MWEAKLQIRRDYCIHRKYHLVLGEMINIIDILGGKVGEFDWKGMDDPSLWFWIRAGHEWNLYEIERVKVKQIINL